MPAAVPPFSADEVINQTKRPGRRPLVVRGTNLRIAVIISKTIHVIGSNAPSGTFAILVVAVTTDQVTALVNNSLVLTGVF